MEYRIYVPSKYMTTRGHKPFTENKFQSIVDSLCINLRMKYDIKRIYVREEICYLEYNFTMKTNVVHFRLDNDISDSLDFFIKKFESRFFQEGEIIYEVVNYPSPKDNEL